MLCITPLIFHALCSRPAPATKVSRSVTHARPRGRSKRFARVLFCPHARQVCSFSICRCLNIRLSIIVMVAGAGKPLLSIRNARVHVLAAAPPKHRPNTQPQQACAFWRPCSPAAPRSGVGCTALIAAPAPFADFSSDTTNSPVHFISSGSLIHYMATAPNPRHSLFALALLADCHDSLTLCAQGSGPWPRGHGPTPSRPFVVFSNSQPKKPTSS